MEKLVLKSINDLLALTDKFYIPSYQRGYRWGKEQALALLNDIWNFRQNNLCSNKEVFYCLQPVVVSRNPFGLELIDGQQRITTILIIMQCLKKQMDALDKTPYKICYETRVDSEDFLENLNKESLTKRNDNVDYYHICEVYDAVNEWFTGRDGTDKLNFLNTLISPDSTGKNVKVIWYDVTEENTDERLAIDIFTRLNIGKIPLTNAELIKALFLIRSNFEQQANLKQIQIATEWDNIEKRLQDDSFWYFIYSPKNSISYENRIEYIFDLIQLKNKDHEDYHTFNEFYRQFEESKEKESKLNVDKHWLKIKKYFLTLEEWYSNHDLYHLIGFLIEYGADINELRMKCEALDKSKFISYLKSLIKKRFSYINLDALDYDRDKKSIKMTLLMFNIETILATQKAEMRFPFNKFKQDKWDIEHVSSQTEKKIETKNRIYWLYDLLEYFTGNKVCDNELLEGTDMTLYQKQIETINNFSDDEHKLICTRTLSILENEKIEEDQFEALYNYVIQYFKEDVELEKNSISNLTLLDANTNRSYGNSLFPIKRKRIIENDKNGLFVPICTKNLFLKYYSRQMKDAWCWQKQDAEDYISSIHLILKEYLP